MQMFKYHTVRGRIAIHREPGECLSGYVWPMPWALLLIGTSGIEATRQLFQQAFKSKHFDVLTDGSGQSLNPAFLDR